MADHTFKPESIIAATWSKAALSRVLAEWNKNSKNAKPKQSLGSLRLVSEAKVMGIQLWNDLPDIAHKYDRGHLLVIGGSVGKLGAPILAATAALRAGAGWVTVCLAQKDISRSPGISAPPELTFEDLYQAEQAPRLDTAKLSNFLHERRVRSVVVGPGWMDSGLNPAVMRMLCDHVLSTKGAIIVDAGATKDLCNMTADLSSKQLSIVLATPHPGEWSRLSSSIAAPVIDSPAGLEAARAYVANCNITVLYKGANPIFLDPNSGFLPMAICSGDNTLARAGSGDVLAGVIGALSLREKPIWFAAIRGQCQVARAAKMAAKKVGKHAVLASDMMAYLGL